jgi:hypothetical protein
MARRPPRLRPLTLPAFAATRIPLQLILLYPPFQSTHTLVLSIRAVPFAARVREIPLRLSTFDCKLRPPVKIRLMPDHTSLFAPAPGLSPGSAKQPVRSKVGGLAVILAAPILILYLCIQLIAATSDFQWRLMGFAFLALGWMALHSLGSRLRSTDALDAMQRDPRAPVVFLRPFRVDERTTQDAPQGDREGGERATMHSFKSSHENSISRALSKLGPFVAIGRPGERLAPSGGAARAYLSHQDWKPVVESLVRRAVAVVLQPEPSEGTLWEVNLVAGTVDRRRVLLLVPNSRLRPLGFIRVSQLIEERFGVSLPPQSECLSCDAFSFDLHGHAVPISLPPENEWSHRDASAALAPFIKLVSELGSSVKETV